MLNNQYTIIMTEETKTEGEDGETSEEPQEEEKEE